MQSGFWSDLAKPFTILAPMADVTDVPFRRIIAECGRPDVFYTEFISADGLCSQGRTRLIKDLSLRKEDHPIVAQFFGAKPAHFYQCAKLARELGFDGVDINMGCPERKVVKNGAGIGLCKTPALALEIINATKEGAEHLPVSVKTRLGYSTIELSWIETLLGADIPALTVHLRTMKEMSKVPAHWELVPEIVTLARKTGTLVVGNGDIASLREANEKAATHGCDGIMIGRGIFQNPWLFNANKSESFDRSRSLEVDPHERLDLLLRHTRYFTEFWGNQKSFNVLKRFYKIYVSGWDGAKELRTKLMETRNAAQVEEIISQSLQSTVVD